MSALLKMEGKGDQMAGERDPQMRPTGVPIRMLRSHCAFRASTVVYVAMSGAATGNLRGAARSPLFSCCYRVGGCKHPVGSHQNKRHDH